MSSQAKLREYGPPGGAAAAAAAAASGEGGPPGAAVGGGLPSRRRLAHHYLALASSGLDQQVGVVNCRVYVTCRYPIQIRINMCKKCSPHMYRSGAVCSSSRTPSPSS